MNMPIAHLANSRPAIDQQTYYDQLCDPDFFGRSSYSIVGDQSSIRMDKPGIPLWHTAATLGRPLSRAARQNLARLALRKDIGSTVQPDLGVLAELVLLDLSYRLGDDREALRAATVLRASGDQGASARAAKIQRAVSARRVLQDEVGDALSLPLTLPKDMILGETVTLLSSICAERFCAEKWTADDIAVEAPVRKDFLRRGTSRGDRLGLLSFYRETLSYVLELTAANYQVETLSNYSRALDSLDNLAGCSMLDYAGGIGTFSILAAKRGCSVEFAELESVTQKYARNRIASRPSIAKQVKFSTIRDDGLIPDGQWDVVVCTELLEHVFEPFVLLERLLERITPNGYLLVSESFNHVEEFCTHLPQHKGLGGNVFVRKMKERGLAPVLVEPDCHVQVWRVS